MRSFGCFKSLEFTTSSGKHLRLSVAFTISFLFHTGKLLKTQHASRYLNSKLPRCENIEDVCKQYTHYYYLSLLVLLQSTCLLWRTKNCIFFQPHLSIKTFLCDLLYYPYSELFHHFCNFI